MAQSYQILQVMLTEPLNASLIAMYAVNEPPPSGRTIIGVSVVLMGCAIVLWESSKDARDGLEKKGRQRSDTKETLDSFSSDEEGYGATSK